MTFAHPWALLLGLLAAGVVFLQRLRPAVHRETLSTGMFWERVLAADPVRVSWLRVRDTISLAIRLAVVFLVTLAAAEPQIPPPRRLVVVLDTGASMQAGRRAALAAGGRQGNRAAGLCKYFFVPDSQKPPP